MRVPHSLNRAVVLALALVILAGSVPAAPVSAQTSPDDSAATVLHQCAPDAALLVAVVTSSTDPARAAAMGDLITQLSNLRDRRVRVLVGWAGVVFEPVLGWEQVTPESAPRLAGLVRQAAEDATVTTFDPLAALDQVADEMAVEAARVGGETCSLTVFDPGAESVEVDDPTVVVVPPDRAELVTELAGLVATIRGGTAAIESIAVCAAADCDRGLTTIDLPSTIGRFAITVVLPSDAASVVVGLPRGVSFPVDDRVAAQINAGSFDIAASWPAPDIVRLEAEVSPSESDWPGTWTVSVVDPEAASAGANATLVSAVTAGVRPQFTGSMRLVAGRPVTIRAELVDSDERLIDRAETLDAVDLAVVARDADGQELSRADLEAGPTGVWLGTFGLAPDVDVDRVTLALVATVDTGHQTPIEVVAEARAEILPPSVWPTMASELVEIDGDAGGQVAGVVSITAGEGVDACAWIEDDTVDLGGVVAPVSLAGGARSAASCVRVPADSSVDLPLTFDIAEVDPGAYSSSVTLAYGPLGDEAYETVEIDLSFELASPIDVARRVQITIGMSLIALVVPLLALWGFDWATARFRPSRRAVAAEAWIAVWPDDSIYRVDTDGSPLLLGDDDFEPAQLSRARRFEWRGFQLSVRNATSPLTPPMAVVESPAGPVAGSMGALVDHGTVLGRVPLNLAPSWIFELQPDATREAAQDPTAPDFYAAYGRLVVIRRPDSPSVDLSELAHTAQRLALTVRRARLGDAATAREMLDFVETNVSTPRDLPRRHSAMEEVLDDPEPVEPSPFATADPYDFSDLATMFEPEPERAREAEGRDPAGADEEGVEAHDVDEQDADEQRVGEQRVDEQRVEDQDAEAYGGEEDATAQSPGLDLGPTDHWDDIEVESPSAQEAAPFGIVFEESVNPEAFLDSVDPAQPASDASPAPTDPPADPRTSWARKARPSWPTSRPDRDS